MSAAHRGIYYHAVAFYVIIIKDDRLCKSQLLHKKVACLLNIRFSRHALRRAKLYGISDYDLVEALNKQPITSGRSDIIVDIDGFIYPIKIVVECNDHDVMVITNYPLKKGAKP